MRWNSFADKRCIWVPYHQVVFDSSSIAGDLAYTIDAAFESLVEIEKIEDNELHIVDNVIFDRLLNEEVELVRVFFIPSLNPTIHYNTSYRIILDYTLGLDLN